jgi:hypothetical protein
MTSMRALVAAAHYSRRRVLLLAPTGKAVDAAVWESAGDTGYTVAKGADIPPGRVRGPKLALWLHSARPQTTIT